MVSDSQYYYSVIKSWSKLTRIDDYCPHLRIFLEEKDNLVSVIRFTAGNPHSVSGLLNQILGSKKLITEKLYFFVALNIGFFKQTGKLIF